MDPDAPYYASGYLTVENGKIREIGPMAGYVRPEDAAETDLCGKVVLPGVIHSHSHFYGQFVRGIPLSTPMANWQQILGDMWWKVDKLLDDEMNYYSAMMGLIEGIEMGTTTYIDHHASPNHSIGSLECIEQAVREVARAPCFAMKLRTGTAASAAKTAFGRTSRSSRRIRRPGGARAGDVRVARFLYAQR